MEAINKMGLSPSVHTRGFTVIQGAHLAWRRDDVDETMKTGRRRRQDGDDEGWVPDDSSSRSKRGLVSAGEDGVDDEGGEDTGELTQLVKTQYFLQFSQNYATTHCLITNESYSNM